MTPAEHYAEAERLLTAVETLSERTDLPTTTLALGAAAIHGLLSMAQIHATLATVSVDELFEDVELTDQERMVLRDAIRSDREIRNDTGGRESLLRSAAKKLDLEL